MERNKLAHPPRNNQRTSETLNPSQQNHLQSAHPAIGGRNSQFRDHNTSERTHNFHHTPHDHHQPVVPPYGPWYLIRVPNQWFGSSMAVPNQSSSVGFHSLQAAQYSMEEQTFIMDAVENNLNSTYTQTASSSHGNNNVYGGSLDARRDMGRVQYPEIENYVNFYSVALPYYTDGYQLHPHPPPSAMQAMRGNNFNSRPQVPSSSSNRPQMNPQPQQHNTLPYSSGSMDDWNPSIPLGQMTTAEDPLPPIGLPPIGSIFRRLDMLREHTANLMLRDNFAFTSYEDYLAFGTTSDHAVEYANLIGLLTDHFDFDSYGWLANLEEPMGHANVGLSNEEVHMHLQIRTHSSPADQLSSEPDICVICQGEYENDERIGTLPCGHEYHVDCIKKWLQQKTVCPLCKAPARA
ncbi:uncharacterized protein LOC130761290 [Actinidia eriantha]|uniref:uncharacterized protein LOC130761290 n=1 Tax=Actinidia eriantha TaxID=165200 RepID=UPI00258F1BC0|nr:uncharacterized protein LOC130761290 [Actinidia eriantha]